MEDNASCTLKTGYLLKFENSKKWKVRWIVLHEDQLVCHHRKEKSVTLAVIPLLSASVIICQADEEELLGGSQDAFKISLPEGVDLYFKAAGKEDRDSWAHAIGAVIRSLTGSKLARNDRTAFPSFRAYANVSDILGAIQEQDAGVVQTNHVRNGAVYKNCFKGSDVVDWLLRWSIVRKRDAGAKMAQMLLKLGHVQEVDINDGAQGVSGKFCDGDRLYRFTSMNLGHKKNSFYDSTESEDDSSDDEDNVDEATKLRKGRIIGERFLLKKRPISKEWHVVKVILRENPPSLEYSRAVRLQNGMPARSKIFSLATFVLQEPKNPRQGNEGSGELQQPKQGAKGKQKWKIVLKGKNSRRCIKFKAKDKEEWHQWRSLLKQSLGSTPEAKP